MPFRSQKRTLSALPLPVVRPIPARALVAGVSVVILAATLFAYSMEVPLRETVPGWLEPAGGEVRISAPQAGSVIRLAHTGDHLGAGGVVAVLEAPKELTPHAPPASEGDIVEQKSWSLSTVQASTVLATTVAPGSLVSKGQLIAVLAPQNAPLKAALLVPTRAAARVKVGQRILVRLAAFPQEVLPAVIEQVDETSLSAQDSLMLKSEKPTNRYVRAIASIGGAALPQAAAELKPGMELEASIELERRSLLAWLVWPLVKNIKEATAS